jgi:hypothetical protein
MKGLAHVEAHPVHPLRLLLLLLLLLLLRPLLAVILLRVPPPSEPYGAILSRIPISGVGVPRRIGWPCIESPRGAVLCEPYPVRRATTELYSRSTPKG